MLPLAHSGGFGINTNILETNIINLAAVVGIVVSFVGSNLTALLEDRRKNILSNLEEANQRALEAQEKLNSAKASLELAKKKAQEIREEGVSILPTKSFQRSLPLRCISYYDTCS